MRPSLGRAVDAVCAFVQARAATPTKTLAEAIEQGQAEAKEMDAGGWVCISGARRRSWMAELRGTTAGLK